MNIECATQLIADFMGENWTNKYINLDISRVAWEIPVSLDGLALVWERINFDPNLYQLNSVFSPDKYWSCSGTSGRTIQEAALFATANAITRV